MNSTEHWKMGKYNKKKIELILGITFVFLIFSCNMLSKRQPNKSAVLTIIIKRENRNEQRNFEVYDWNTNLKFSEIIKDSVYQIQQKLLKDKSFLSIDGRYSCQDSGIPYSKTYINDTIKFFSIYCLPIY